MAHCPLCGESKLPDIRVPGVIWIDNRLIFRHNHVADFRVQFGHGRESALLDIALRSWPRPAPYEICTYAVWPRNDEPDDPLAALKVHAAHIRDKIDHAGLGFWAVNGVGYKFYLPEER